MVKETTRVSKECGWVEEKVTTWAVRVTREGQSEPEEHRLEVSQIIGQSVRDKLPVHHSLVISDQRIETGNFVNVDEPWISASVIVRPLLNCYDQTSPELISLVRQDHVSPPSTQKYNLTTSIFGRQLSSGSS